MEKIFLLIDLDGYQFNKRFQIRELGWYDTNRHTHGSYHFDLSLSAPPIGHPDWEQITFATQNIHSLSLTPHPDELLQPPESVHHVVKYLYKRSKTEAKRTVAYKGGHIERDLLRDVQLPSVNLEDYGCKPYKEIGNPLFVYGCGYHLKGFHCTQQEVVAYYNWMNTKL